MFPRMTDEDVHRVVTEVRKGLRKLD